MTGSATAESLPYRSQWWGVGGGGVSGKTGKGFLQKVKLAIIFQMSQWVWSKREKGYTKSTVVIAFY